MRLISLLVPVVALSLGSVACVGSEESVPDNKETNEQALDLGGEGDACSVEDKCQPGLVCVARVKGGDLDTKGVPCVDCGESSSSSSSGGSTSSTSSSGWGSTTSSSGWGSTTSSSGCAEADTRDWSGSTTSSGWSGSTSGWSSSSGSTTSSSGWGSTTSSSGCGWSSSSSSGWGSTSSSGALPEVGICIRVR